MINLLEGVPGSGKSYEAVVYHVLEALKAGRKVITNLPLRLEAFRMLFPEYVHLIELVHQSRPIYGMWDAEAAGRGEKAFIIGKFPEGAVTQKDHEGRECLLPPPGLKLFGQVWDFYDEWRGKNNIGPLYVIDECHVSFPKTKPRRGVHTPEDVIQWFKISRHSGADILLITQRMSALEEEIAGLAEFHIRVRKAAFLGKPNHYVRRVFAGYRGGEISNDQREYLSQYFCLYQSHTQGSTVIESRQEDVQPAHLKWQRRSRYMLLFSAFGFVWLGWKIFLEEPKKPASKMQPIALSGAASKPAEINPVAPASINQPASSLPATVQHAVYVPPADTSIGPEPFEARGVHLTGCMERLSTHETICTFVVSQNGMPLFQITDAELREYGYSFKLLGHCAGHITWGGKVRAVVCDVPQVGMQVAGVGRK